MDLDRTGQETIDLSNKSAADTTILKIPKERDSLHKFAISKMLGITDEEEDGVPKAPKLTRTDPEVKKVDENCNNVANTGMYCKELCVRIKSDFIIVSKVEIQFL